MTSTITGPLGIDYSTEYSARTLALVSAETFALAYGLARGSSDRIREATSDFDWYECHRRDYWLSIDGRSGFAVDSDDTLLYVFSLERGRGDLLVEHAVRNGANNLDCFDGYLVDLYGRHGFREVRRESNWTPGGPDVVFMTRTCVCARHDDSSVTTFLCPLHADVDPCLTMAQVTGRRRKGSIRNGVCSNCGHGA